MDIDDVSFSCGVMFWCWWRPKVPVSISEAPKFASPQFVQLFCDGKKWWIRSSFFFECNPMGSVRVPSKPNCNYRRWKQKKRKTNPLNFAMCGKRLPFLVWVFTVPSPPFRLHTVTGKPFPASRQFSLSLKWWNVNTKESTLINIPAWLPSTTKESPACKQCTSDNFSIYSLCYIYSM